MIYEDIYTSPMSAHQFIESYLNDLKDIDRPGRVTGVHPNPRPKCWLPPPMSLAKVNVDAATKRNQKRGTVAAVCRDENGLFLGASAISFKGVDDPTTLEAMAVRESLALAQDLNELKIHVATDCKVVVEDIKTQCLASYGAIIHEILEARRAFSICNFVHEFRSSNFEAHNLAKHALTLGVGRHVWLGHPGNLSFVPVNVVTS